MAEAKSELAEEAAPKPAEAASAKARKKGAG
jgi:hypothetical protein